MKKTVSTICLIVLAVTNLLSQQSDIPKLTGPYLGQKPPGTTPEIFAPDIISSKNAIEYIITFSPDLSEIYFTRDGIGIMLARLIDGIWTSPVETSFNSKYPADEPFITPNGEHLLLNRFVGLVPGEKGGIYSLTRINGKWENPVLCAEFCMRATAASNGNIYATDIEAAMKGGKDRADIVKFIKTATEYTRINIDKGAINSDNDDAHPFIAPDENYMIFNSNRPGGVGERDLYVSFRMKDGLWSNPVNIKQVNTEKDEWGATVSPDGKYLFFTRSQDREGDIYWIDAKIIEELRLKE
jgi:hypothetical protein